MKESPTNHPTPEKLAAYRQGRLPAAEHAAIEVHVTRCPTCRLRLQAPVGESLADLIHSVSTPAGADTGPDLGEAGSAVHSPVPPELAEHPRYRVLGLLGVGGMGAVYKAEHKMMERTVALKVINKKLLEDPQSVERFRREVKTAAKLAHPNIVAAHDAEQAGDVHFLVMEYVEGQSLAQLVEEHGRLPVLNACHYIRQAAQGLQHAHELGMIHRDLKPQNLMLTPKGQVKILDFGLARLAQGNGKAAALTHENAVVGTPDYIAPEQATDARQADIRADIYSLGCTLYYLLTGELPFPDGTAMQKVLAHIEKPLRSVTELRTDLPDGLAAVLERMLAKDPSQRYRTPAEVAEALLPFSKLDGAAQGNRALEEQRSRGKEELTSNPGKAALLCSAALPLPPFFRRFMWAGLGSAGVAVLSAGVLGLGLLAWTVFRVETSNGTLVIKTDDPDVQVIVKQDGKQVRIVDTKSGKEVTLQAGTYNLELNGGKPGLKLSTDRFTLTRNDRQIVEVTREAAVAPPAVGPKSPTSGKTPVPVKPLPLPEPGEKTASLLRALEGAQAQVVGLAFAPDGRRVVACTQGTSGIAGHNAVRLWDTESGQVLAAWEEPNALFAGVTFASDGRIILSCGRDEPIRLYDADNRQYLGPFGKSPFKTEGLQVTPDGKQVLLVGGSSYIEVWDFATRTQVRRFFGMVRGVESIALSADGKCLVANGTAGSEGWYIHVWDVESGQKRFRPGPLQHKIHQVAVSPDGSRALSCGADNLIRLWDLTTGEELRQLKAPSEPLAVAFAPDGRRALCGVAESSVLLLDAGNLEVLARLTHPRGSVRAVAFTADGKRAVSGTDNGDIRIWRFPAEKPD